MNVYTYKFFVYCPEVGFEVFETLNDALEDANEKIKGYLGDGWSEEVTGVCVGKITHRAKMCDQVFPVGKNDEDGLDEAGDYWDPDYGYKCNYKVIAHPLPAEQQPELAKYQPCGCVLCTCEHETQCQGCGAKHCGTHPVGQLPAPAYIQPAEQQPAPDVAKLVEALEEMIGVAERADSWESFPSDPIGRAEDAIRAYRKQGGGL